MAERGFRASLLVLETNLHSTEGVPIPLVVGSTVNPIAAADPRTLAQGLMISITIRISSLALHVFCVVMDPPKCGGKTAMG